MIRKAELLATCFLMTLASGEATSATLKDISGSFQYQGKGLGRISKLVIRQDKGQYFVHVLFHGNPDVDWGEVRANQYEWKMKGSRCDLPTLVAFLERNGAKAIITLRGMGIVPGKGMPYIYVESYISWNTEDEQHQNEAGQDVLDNIAITDPDLKPSKK